MDRWVAIRPDSWPKDTQMYDIDYFKTVSPIARMNSIRIIFSVAVNLFWSLCQLDVKNAFLCGNLKEKSVYEATSMLCCSRGE